MHRTNFVVRFFLWHEDAMLWYVLNRLIEAFGSLWQHIVQGLNSYAPLPLPLSRHGQDQRQNHRSTPRCLMAGV
jgi:hypothetical protein